MRMLNNRLSELQQVANPPYLGASVGIGEFIANLGAMTASVNAKPGELETGFKALVRELERVQKFGFTKTEYERALIQSNKNVETQYIERDKIKSGDYVYRYLEHFLNDAYALSNEDSYQLFKKLAPTLTLEEVNALTKEYYLDINRDVVILAPEKDKASLPSESVVNQWFSSVEAENITPYEDKVSSLPMLSKQPQKGKIVSEKKLTKIEAKELKLSNGIKVVLKQTDFKNDQIIINGLSKGGTSLYGDKDYFSASYANDLVQESGLGQLNKIELKNQLAGKNVSVSPYLDEHSEGISAYSDKEGLKTAFEMIYGYFTEPRIDDDVFQSIIARNLASLANREDNPQFVFGREIRKTLYNGNIRRMPVNEDDIKSIDKEKALQIFKDRFADASDFTFVIVGSFDEKEIKPLLEEYLASLPKLNRKEKWKDLGIYEPKIGVEKVVNKGKEEDKVNVILSYYGDYKNSNKEDWAMDALESVLSIRLLERLREEEGGIYSTRASISYSEVPKGRFNTTIAFGTSTGKYQSLIKSSLDEIEKLKKEGPSQTDLDKFKVEFKRKFELQVKENDYWLWRTSLAYYYKKPLRNPSVLLKELDKVTIKSVQEVAKKYLNENQLFKFILLPDNKK